MTESRPKGQWITARISVYDTAQLLRIQQAAGRRDWFTAVVLTATQLERHGYWVILEYLAKLKSVEPKLADLLVEPLSLFQLTDCLLL